MKTVFARALVVLAVIALPASAFASAKTHSHDVAKKEPKKKTIGKHHAGHKSASAKTGHVATAAKAP